MADLTYGELQQMVGRKLQIIADTQTLSAEDGELVQDALLSVQAQLSRIGAGTLDVENGIFEPYAEPVAMMAAAQLVDEFGIPEPRRGALIAQGLIGVPGRSLAERRFRQMIDGVTVKLKTTTDVTVV